jgi:hypothetical protein
MKPLTIENLLTPDPAILAFGKVSPDTGEASPMSHEEWAQIFIAFELSKDVPAKLVQMFEVAKGAMLYGYFVYPLFALGLEQVYRVADEATGAKCEMIGIPANKRKTFEKKIESLVSAGILTATEADEWHGVRKLRNSASHASQQTIITPAMAAMMLDFLIEKINALFG